MSSLIQTSHKNAVMYSAMVYSAVQVIQQTQVRLPKKRKRKESKVSKDFSKYMLAGVT